MHIRSHEKSLLAVVVDRVAGDLRRCLADGVLRGLEYAHVVHGQRCLARDVQTDHRDGNAGLKHNARRLRVHVNIELRRGRDVPSRERPAHHDHALYHRGKLRIRIQCGGDIG